MCTSFEVFIVTNWLSIGFDFGVEVKRWKCPTSERRSLTRMPGYGTSHCFKWAIHFPLRYSPWFICPTLHPTLSNLRRIAIINHHYAVSNFVTCLSAAQMRANLTLEGKSCNSKFLIFRKKLKYEITRWIGARSAVSTPLRWRSVQWYHQNNQCCGNLKQPIKMWLHSHIIEMTFSVAGKKSGNHQKADHSASRHIHTFHSREKLLLSISFIL